MFVRQQFELEKKFFARGGVVIDEGLRNKVCDNIILWVQDKMRWKVNEIIQSPIKGPKGNIEYLIHASK